MSNRRSAHVYIVDILYYSRTNLPSNRAFDYSENMGYPVKIQKVDRPTNRSYYVNFPVALADALGIRKGEKFNWLLEDKNTLVLQRQRRVPPRKLKIRPR